jgi:thymidylate kinase
MDEAGVRWSLLRDPEALAEPGGDIDMLVEPSGLGHMRTLLVEQGFVPLPLGRRDLHAADYDVESDRFLWLHVQTELRLGDGAVAAAAILEVLVRDPLPRPADTWLFWVLLLHGMLDKDDIAERDQSALTRLADAVGPPAYTLEQIAAAHGLPTEVVVPLVAARDWDGLRRLTAQRRLSTRRIRERVAGARDRVGGLWTRRGISVAVIGPDGAGKTTLVNGLRSTFPFPTRVIYMGLTGGRLPKADALRVPGLVLAARLALLWTRYGVSLYHRARGRVVLFDRYTLDAVAPSGALLGPLARVSRRVQGAACPNPGLVLLLDASGATMHRRKSEYEPDQLEAWREAYHGLRNVVGMLEVLDAERPADLVRREAQAHMWRRYAERWLPRAKRPTATKPPRTPLRTTP